MLVVLRRSLNWGIHWTVAYRRAVLIIFQTNSEVKVGQKAEKRKTNKLTLPCMGLRTEVERVGKEEQGFGGSGQPGRFQ